MKMSIKNNKDMKNKSNDGGGLTTRIVRFSIRGHLHDLAAYLGRQKTV